MAPAFGFFCQSDGDLQCPFGRCIQGRCGGCATANDCKAGATCAPSPVGMACWPAYGPQQQIPQTPPTQVPPPPAASGDPFAQARQTCVDRINRYRARVGSAPVRRDTNSERCADEQARLDARSNMAHGSFGRCGEWAQNACPNYPGRTVEEVLDRCLEQMFGEGPGGGHYENMVNRRYTAAFCGFEPSADGRIWSIQNFR